MLRPFLFVEVRFAVLGLTKFVETALFTFLRFTPVVYPDYLDVRAGRHGTAEVAQYFNADITGDNALGIATSKDPALPSELNFAVSGTLTVATDQSTMGCPDMKIAQGHHVGVNNWWMAGTKCYHSAMGGLECPCGNHTVIFHDGCVEWEFESNIFSVWFEIEE